MLSKIYQVGSPLKSIISLSSGIEIEWKKSKIDKNGSYKKHCYAQISYKCFTLLNTIHPLATICSFNCSSYSKKIVFILSQTLEKMKVFPEDAFSLLYYQYNKMAKVGNN